MSQAPSKALSWFEEFLTSNIEVTYAKNVRRADLEAWLYLMEVELTEHNYSNSTVTAYQYLQYLLAITKSLLIACRIPHYKNPIIESWTEIQERQAVKASVYFYHIDFISPNTYRSAINVAMNCLRHFTNHALSAENIESVYKYVNDKLVSPLTTISPIGKSTMQMLSVATKLGIPWLHLGGGVFQLGWGCNSTLIHRSSTILDSAIGAQISHNKALSAHFLRTGGLPSPEHKVVKSSQDAIQAAETIGYPLVAKPCDQDRGEGITTGITTPEVLDDAFKKALQASPSNSVLIEKLVPGDCHRVFVSQGKLLYAVKRYPTSMIGDGINSIEALISEDVANQKKRPPWVRSSSQPIDALTRKTLEQQGLSLQSIVRKNERVSLRPVESTEWGGFDEDVTRSIHPENIRIALEATKLLGLDVAGVDIISSDITQPWHSNNAIINEVNYTPLLGGGEISRTYIPEFLNRSLNNTNGTIPFARFDGKDARREHRDRVSSGKRCFITCSTKTLGPDLAPIPMLTTSLKERVKALLLRKDVDSVLVVENNRL